MSDWFEQAYNGYFGDLPENIRGRNLRGGYARGSGIEFSNFHKILYEKDKLWCEAMKIATTLHKSGQFRSITSEQKLANIYLILKYFWVEAPAGHIVEFGSFRGGSAAFMAYVIDKIAPGVKVFALDTFTGMPKTDPNKDQHKEGDFSDNNLDDVRSYIDDAGIRNVELVQGLFENTVKDLLPRVGKVSLSHIDCDIYSACVTAYQGVKPYMVKNGFYVLDDPTFGSCLGAFEFVEDFLIRGDGLSAEQVFPHMVFRAA